MSRLIVLPLCALLLGCGLAAKVDARNAMERSRDAYKVCLAEKGVAGCAAERETYRADLAAFRAASAGVRPGLVVTSE